MAHFAELDENNIVLRVIVVGNADTADADGNESEAIGQQFCADLLGGTWVQASWSGSLRSNFAAVGYTYDAALDAFTAPQPYPSWSLDANHVWQAPVAYPYDNETGYYWDEDTTSWVEVE